MSDKWQYDHGTRRDNQMVSEDRVICILPKNQSIEQRVIVKGHQTRKNRKLQAFIDVREWWFKDGHLEKPIPTKKGTMIHREHVVKLVTSMLGEMSPDEVTDVQIRELETQIARLKGAID